GPSASWLDNYDGVYRCDSCTNRLSSTWFAIVSGCGNTGKSRCISETSVDVPPDAGRRNSGWDCDDDCVMAFFELKISTSFRLWRVLLRFLVRHVVVCRIDLCIF